MKARCEGLTCWCWQLADAVRQACYGGCVIGPLDRGGAAAVCCVDTTRHIAQLLDQAHLAALGAGRCQLGLCNLIDARRIARDVPGPHAGENI